MARHKSLIPKDFDGNYTEDMLTERQKQVLNFIRSYAQAKGYPPSVREICKHYKVELVELRNVDKKGGHPSIAGMKAIADQLK